jgi:carboxymethylenebutenolidase
MSVRAAEWPPQTGEVPVVCHAEVPKERLRDGPSRDEMIPLPDGSAMPGYLALPESGSGPGVLVVCDMYGRSPFYENLAGRIAGLGYVALCPEPFHRIGDLSERTFDRAIERRAASDELQMLADLDAAISWMQQQPEVTAERVGVMGFCMGGTFTLNLAGSRSDLASCCFYGFPGGSTGPAVTAPAPLDIVDRLSGPMIGFWGEDDTAVGLDNVERFISAVSQRDIVFHSVTYPRVGHGFMAEESKDSWTQDAARHGWVRMTAFLRRHLADV